MMTAEWLPNARLCATMRVRSHTMQPKNDVLTAMQRKKLDALQSINSPLIKLVFHEFRLIYKKHGQQNPDQCKRAAHFLKHDHAFQSVMKIKF